MTSYAPLPCEPRPFGIVNDTPPRCRHCGQRVFVHTEDERCYTPLELEAALRFMQAHGHWPTGMLAPPP